MALFNDERLTRLTISVTRAHSGAGWESSPGEPDTAPPWRGSLARHWTWALDQVSEVIDRERTAAATDGVGTE